jgi:magnesium chelatase family protein
VDFDKLSDARQGETSKTIRDRVDAARERQRRRFAGYVDGHSQLLTNADMGLGEIREFCAVDDAGHSLLRAAMRQLHMRARLPPHAQGGPHHRRPDRRRAHQGRAPG